MQENKCREYAEREGYEVAKVFSDTSEKEFWFRDGFQELLSFCLPENNNCVGTVITTNMHVLIQNDPLQLTTIIEQLSMKKVQIKVATNDEYIAQLLAGASIMNDKRPFR